MSLSTRVGGTALVAAALTVGLVPPASAAPVEHDRRGNLLVCVHDLRGRDAEIEVSGRSDRDADTDGGCTFFHRLKTGWYDVELNAPGVCDDDSDEVKVRRNRTAVVHLDADCPRLQNFEWQRWSHDNDGDDDDGDDDD